MVLEGMKIVSFCHFLQGPAAMQYLADMGAEVIKIEPPEGAFERHWAGADRAKVGDTSAFFLCANRNALSIALDLKKPEAKDVAFRLIDKCHAVAENFRPGTLDRLGLGYEEVRLRKPNIIYASASGFGQTGPYMNRPGQDLLIQAMSGLAATTGTPQTGPVSVGCAAVDQHGAALFALGIAGAYARLLQSGQGTRVETTLLGAGVDLQMESLVTYYASGAKRQTMQRDAHLGSWFHDAPYGIYRTADGYIALSMNDLRKLANALESDDLLTLADQNAYHQRDRIAGLVASEIARHTFSELATAFEARKMWFTRVEDFDDLLVNPQIVHNQTFCDAPVNDATVKVLNHPNRYDGEGAKAFQFALKAGANTREILGNAGFSDAEICDLLNSKIAFASN